MNKYFQYLVLTIALCFVFPPPSQGTGNDNPTGVTGEYNGSITTGGSYDPYTGNAKRVVTDLTVTGSLGAYPLKWTRILNTRGVAGIGFGHGGTWKNGYNWGLWLRPYRPWHYYPDPYEGPDGVLTYPDGRRKELVTDESRMFYWANDGVVEPDDQLVSAGNGHFDLILADGGRVEFRHNSSQAPEGFYSLTARRIIDPHGLVTTLERDTSNRLWKIIEPGGRYLEITYTTRSYTIYLNNAYHTISTDVISKVEAFSRPGQPTEKVLYHYEEEDRGFIRFYNLMRADYDDLTHASYTYLPASAPPPHFTSLVPGRIETCDDPRYAGAMGKIEYVYAPYGNIHGPVTIGKIKGEKYPGAPTFVSEVIYPQYEPYTEDPPEFLRTERRGDGSTRTFQYSNNGDAELQHYTDFKGQPSFIDWPGGGTVGGYVKTLTNARGKTSSVEKDNLTGAVLKTTHPGGAFVRFHYSDENNRRFVFSRTDERGKITYYDRDGANRIWRIRHPDNGFETFTFDNNPFGLVHQHRLTSGGIEVFEYDGRGLKTAYTPPATSSDPNPAEHKTLYFYYGGPSGEGMAPEAAVRPDLIDRLQRVIDPRGNSTWFEYNPRGQVTKVTHPDGSFTHSHYNDDGTLQWTKDELGHKTSYEYDEYKRVTRVVNPLGQETRNDYTPRPVNGVALSPLSHTTSSVYRVTSHLQKITEYGYDENFRRTRVTVAPGTPDAATTTSTYDEVGNLKTVRDPKGQTTGRETIYDYDDRNRRTGVTDALGHTTTWEYDDASNKKKETRADTKFRTWDEYDPMNRIKHTTGFLGEPTSYQYDLAGNLTEMMDAKGAIYHTAYDELNRKKSAIYPPDADNASRTETWLYDAAGNLKTYKNPANQFKRFEYDVRNRQRRSYWNSSPTETNVDWSVGPETITTPDEAGRVLEIRTNGGQTIVAYGYDNANRKIWEDQTVAGLPTRRVETNPDDDGSRATLSVAGVPGGYSFTYQYTQRQQLRHISRGGSPYVEFSYDVSGNLTKRQHMAQGQGHDSTKFQYDDLNRVTLCEQTGHNDQLFARSNYNDYDLVNNLKSISREEDGNKGEIFEYDDANQLSSVSYRTDIAPRGPEQGGGLGTVVEVEKDEERESVAALEADPDREPLAFLAVEPEPDAAATGPRTVTYNNDAINRLSMSDTATGQTTNYSPNHLNQYTAVTGQGTPSYDEKFNLSGYDGWTYVYDAEKRLISASMAGHSAQFVYDGLGRCVKRTIDTAVTVFTYEEWKPIVEWKGDGAFVAWNLYGPGADEILVRYQPNTGGHVHYHLDALGNVQFLLSGELHLGLEKYTYDVFGRPTITGWNGGPRPISLYGNRFLFTGREYLYTLGIYDYRHRGYHPGLGRFMQMDPIGFKGDPLNLFRYCGGNPVNRSDPLGLDYDLKKDPRDSSHFIAEVPINFIGGTKGDVREFTEGLENGWRGQDGAGRTLTTKVVPVKWYGLQAKLGLQSYNSVKFRSKGDTEVKLGRYVYVNLIKGQYTPRQKAAHEGGHLLGRRDGYVKDDDGDAVMEGGRPKPQDGYDRDNLMVYPPGKASREDIAAVIDGNGRGHGGCLPDGRRTFDAFGSTTAHSMEWEKTWGPGGWIAVNRH